MRQDNRRTVALAEVGKLGGKREGVRSGAAAEIEIADDLLTRDEAVGGALSYVVDRNLLDGGGAAEGVLDLLIGRVRHSCDRTERIERIQELSGVGCGGLYRCDPDVDRGPEKIVEQGGTGSQSNAD